MRRCDPSSSWTTDAVARPLEPVECGHVPLFLDAEDLHASTEQSKLVKSNGIKKLMGATSLTASLMALFST
jgi:hypothetical protein